MQPEWASELVTEGRVRRACGGGRIEGLKVIWGVNAAYRESGRGTEQPDRGRREYKNNRVSRETGE